MSTQLPNEKTIALVMYEGLTPLDLVGPLQVFTALREFAPQYRAVVVAERTDVVGSDVGLKLVPSHTFDEVPRPSVILVPGGGLPTIRAMSNPAIRNYIRTASQTAEYVTSVCTGALILAALGLLKGQPATTHWAFYRILENFGAKYLCKRWVDNGKLIMSAGVSAGIDMALFLVSRLTDESTARQVQRWLDYDPKPPFGKIDWHRIGMFPMALRTALRLAAPLIAYNPKRLLRQNR
jgi:transcriptional regulator GlxA family with amidase domain